jgi:hypothetical protein
MYLQMFSSNKFIVKNLFTHIMHFLNTTQGVHDDIMHRAAILYIYSLSKHAHIL